MTIYLYRPSLVKEVIVEDMAGGGGILSSGMGWG